MRLSSRLSASVKAAVVLVIVLAVLALVFVRSPQHRLSRQLHLGEAYLSQLDYEAAVLAFTNALDIDPRCEQAYWGRGQAYAGLQRHEEAVQDFSFLLSELNADNLEATLARGDEYMALGQTDSARADYETVREKEPDYPGLDDRLETLPPNTVDRDSLVWSVAPQSGFDVVGMVYFEGQGYETQITENGRAVLIDAVRNGSTVIPDGRYAAMRDGQYGLLDLQGNWVAEPIFDSIGDSTVTETEDWSFPDLEYSLSRYGSDGSNGDYLTETFNDAGELVSHEEDPSYSGAAYWFAWDPSAGTPLLLDVLDWSYTLTPERDFPCVIGVPYTDSADRGPMALYASGKLLTDFIFEDVRDFSDGLIAVRQNGKWGYADAAGNLVIPCEYQALRTSSLYTGSSWEDLESRGRVFAASCTEGYVVLYNGSGYALYDAAGNPIIDFGVLEELTEVHNGKLWARMDGQWGVLDLEATLAA